MVGRDVEYHGYVGLEVVHVVELEAAQLHHVDVVRVACHLISQADAHVSGQGGVDACLGEDVVGEHGGGGLAVRAGYADHLGVGVASGELYLADDGDILPACLDDDGSVQRYAGALDDFVGAEYAGHRVAAFLEGYAFVDEPAAVLLCDSAAVAQEYVHAFVFGQDSGPETAFAGSEDNEAMLSGS